MDVRDSRYAGWLEELIGMLMELKPEKICVAAITPNGDVLSGYFGDCGHTDKADMAHNIQLDSLMDVVMANARDIVREAERQEEEDGDGH